MRTQQLYKLQACVSHHWLVFIHVIVLSINTSYQWFVCNTNRRLTDRLSDAQVESKTLHKKLKDCEQQVANMKQQLHKYVAEVKKAEDLLMTKVNFLHLFQLVYKACVFEHSS